MDYLNDEKIYGIHSFLEDIWPGFVEGNIHNMNYKDLEQMVGFVKKFYVDNNLYIPCFEDDDFIINLINSVNIEDIPKYMINTSNYQMRKECDENYVLCFRRAVPSVEPKPENFWSTEFIEVTKGLQVEINNEQRLHSVINVTTLAELKKHGIVITTRGVSDGEIAIKPNKTFSKFLFRYKPCREFWELESYLRDGGKTRDEILGQLRESSFDRMREQGFLPEDLVIEDNGCYNEYSASDSFEDGQNTIKKR